MNDHPADLLGADDDTLLAAVREAFLRADPVPPTLAERVLFALQLEELDLEVELLTLLPEPAGARGEERTRTMTFGSPAMSVMVTVTEEGPGTVRLDGWLDAGEDADDGAVPAGFRLELRLTGGPPPIQVPIEADGRFALEAVPCGLVQFAFRPGDGPDGRPRGRTVVTPAVEL